MKENIIKDVLVMLKRIFLISVFLGLLFLSTACGNSDNGADKSASVTAGPSPEIVMKAGNEDISNVIKSKTLTATNENETELFEAIMKDNKTTIPYVKLGETINIELKDKNVLSCILEDFILKEDGTAKYDKKTVKTSQVSFQKGVGSFVLNENPAAMLSSDSKDYASGKTIRGFKLICSNMKEYVFILRSDAK